MWLCSKIKHTTSHRKIKYISSFYVSHFLLCLFLQASRCYAIIFRTGYLLIQASVIHSFLAECQSLIYVVALKNQTYNVIEKNWIHIVVLCKSLSCVCHPTRTKLGNVYKHATEGRKSRKRRRNIAFPWKDKCGPSLGIEGNQDGHVFMRIRRTARGIYWLILETV